MCYTGFVGHESNNICGKIAGFTLGAAKKIAEEDGYSITDISITSPPRLTISEYDDSFRVLRAKVSDDKSLTVLICKPL